MQESSSGERNRLRALPPPPHTATSSNYFLLRLSSFSTIFFFSSELRRVFFFDGHTEGFRLRKCTLVTEILQDMAATALTPASLTKTKLSFSSNSSQTPLLSRVKTASQLRFLVKKPNGVVIKASISITESKSMSPALNKRTNSPIIVIDNYDSFTYNLCQYMGELGCHFEVYRNDELTVEELKGKNPRGVLISPGPGTPQDSGISLQTVLELGPVIPLFGVCMGLQCIGEAFGGKIVRSPFGVVHGKSSLVHYDEKGEDGLFSGLPNPFTAGRYHSLVIDKDSFPSGELEVTAWTEDGLIMAARHKRYRHLQGVQFHPESIITNEGRTIVNNFVKMLKRKEAQSQN